MNPETALLCSSDERLAAALVEAGFRVIAAPTASEALPALRAGGMRVVMIDDATNGETLLHLNRLEGAPRRALFVVLVSKRANTGDRMAAWRHSVNLIVQPDDLEALSVLLPAALEEEQEISSTFDQAARRIT